MQKLVVVLGPTSTGKTSLAISLCREFNGEIVSADSRQIYKYMDIGTNKGKVELAPLDSTKERFCWKMQGVPIWGVNLVPPTRTMTVVEYSDYAREKIADIWKRGKIPFVVGGTGFYLDVVLGKQEISRIPPNPTLRRELGTLSVEELYARLSAISPEKAATIDRHNPVRLIRAIEVVSGGGAALKYESGFSERFSAEVNSLILGLTASREILYQKADAWADRLFEIGIDKEVKTLIKMGYRQAPPLSGIIYKSILAFLDEKVTKEQAVSGIKGDLHAYIRRQLIWFKRDKRINWLDISEPAFDRDASCLVQSFLTGSLWKEISPSLPGPSL